MRRESGYNGSLISLGGTKGKTGIGRVYTSGYQVVTFAAGGRQIVDSNPNRISLMLTNDGTDKAWIYLGGPADGSNSPLPLMPTQTLQIDALFPWTGAIYVVADAGACGMYFWEVSNE